MSYVDRAFAKALLAQDAKAVRLGWPLRATVVVSVEDIANEMGIRLLRGRKVDPRVVAAIQEEVERLKRSGDVYLRGMIRPGSHARHQVTVSAGGRITVEMAFFERSVQR